MIDFPDSNPYPPIEAALPDRARHASNDRPGISDPSPRPSAPILRPSGPMIDRTQHYRSAGRPSATDAPHAPGSTRHTTFARPTPPGQRFRGSVHPDRRGTTGGLSRRRAQPDTRQQLIDFRGSIPYSAPVAAPPVSGERPLRSAKNQANENYLHATWFRGRCLYCSARIRGGMEGIRLYSLFCH